MSIKKLSWKPLRLNYSSESKENLKWIRIESSLTKALRKKSKDLIRVRLLGQKLAYPSAEEMKEMKLRRRRLALIREVLIFSGNDPWVYAKSIMFTNSHMHHFRWFKQQLKTKGMGDVIFAHEGQSKRLKLKKNNNNNNNNNNNIIPSNSMKISFSRRSLLRFKEVRILLYERFTENFKKCIES